MGLKTNIQRIKSMMFKINESNFDNSSQQTNFSKDNKLNDFLIRLSIKGNLVVNPFNNSELIYDDKASLEINRFDKGDAKEIALQDIVVFDKGMGGGSGVMKDITDTADELGYRITLDAKPFGNDPKSLNIENLVKFYQKNGFMIDLSAYDGEFKSPQEMIDYAIEVPGESIPMYRDPKSNQN